MSFNQAIDEVIRNFANLEDKIQDGGWKFAKQASDAWVYEIHIVYAIDSGDMLRVSSLCQSTARSISPESMA